MQDVMEEFIPTDDIEKDNIIPRPNFSWEKGTFTLWDVNNKIPLPAVVQCDTKSCPVPVDRSRFNFDLTQPLLLHRNRVIRKIPARSLYVDRVTQTYKEIGDPLLIPEDYKGWFSILKKNNKGTLEDSVPHFTTIEEIASSDTEEFLIGGDKFIQTFQILDNNDGNPVQQQRQMFPGDVLRKGKIFTGETKRKSKLFRKEKTVTEKFLLCTDDSDREVLIPFTQTGKFYSLNINTGKLSRPVMQMSEIVSSKLLPCVVKLVYGRVPNTPCSFTGILHLDKDNLEQSVIASTILNFKNILLEIPILCDLKFRVAEIDKEVVSNKGYKSAISLCAEKANIYMRNIKVCHSLSKEPEPPTQSDSSERDDIINSNANKDIPPPTPHITSLSSANSCSSSFTEKSGDRDSGYIKMDSPSRNSFDDGQSLSDELQSISGSETDCSSNVTSYLFKIFLENKYLAVPVYTKTGIETDDNGNYSEDETIIDDADGYSSTPPLTPPPPLPCIGPPPTPCSGSSSATAVKETGVRRPSTVTFYEGSPQEITYASPEMPSRRVSAPAVYDKIPSPKPKTKLERRKRCNRRGSQITFYEGCDTGNAFRETNKSIKRRMSENVLPECDQTSTTSGSSSELHLELDDLEEDEFPIYENIAGLQEIKTANRVRRASCTSQGSVNSSNANVESPCQETKNLLNINSHGEEKRQQMKQADDPHNDVKDSDTSLSSSEECSLPDTKYEEPLDSGIFKRVSYFADDETDVESPESHNREDNDGDSNEASDGNDGDSNQASGGNDGDSNEASDGNDGDSNQASGGNDGDSNEASDGNDGDSNQASGGNDGNSNQASGGNDGESNQASGGNDRVSSQSLAVDKISHETSSLTVKLDGGERKPDDDDQNNNSPNELTNTGSNDNDTPITNDIDDNSANIQVDSFAEDQSLENTIEQNTDDKEVKEPNPMPCSLSNPTYGAEASHSADPKDSDSELIRTDTTETPQKTRKSPPKTLEKTYLKTKQPIAEHQVLKDTDTPDNQIQILQTQRQRSDDSTSSSNSQDGISLNPRKMSNQKRISLYDMSVSELSDALRGVGLKQGTVDTITENKIDGHILSEYREDDQSLKELLPGVGLIEVQKLSMFIKGWRNV